MTKPSSKNGPLPPRKIKGLTEGQTLALLWCGTRWRRVRDEFNNKIFRGRGLRPYVEWFVRETAHGIRFSVRLTEEGADLLAAYGISDPPYFGADFEERSQPSRDSGSDRNGENSRSEVEGAASQSGPERHRPPPPYIHPLKDRI